MANSTNDRSSIDRLLKYCNNFLPIVAIASDLFLWQSLSAIAKPSDRQTTPSNPLPPIQDLSQNIPTTPAIIPQSNATIPVGLNINGKNVLPSMNVRGHEDGEKAVNFDNWLVPFDEVIEALKFNTKVAVNGEIEISSPLFKFQLPANRLFPDPQLGRAIAIKDLNTIPRVAAKFNINKYAIEITSPSLEWTAGSTIVEQPIEVDGLPTAKPTGWGIGAIQERVNFNPNSIYPKTGISAMGSSFANVRNTILPSAPKFPFGDRHLATKAVPTGVLPPFGGKVLPHRLKFMGVISRSAIDYNLRGSVDRSSDKRCRGLWYNWSMALKFRY
jgi:hypothetical protein